MKVDASFTVQAVNLADAIEKARRSLDDLSPPGSVYEDGISTAVIEWDVAVSIGAQVQTGDGTVLVWDFDIAASGVWCEIS